MDSGCLFLHMYVAIGRFLKTTGVEGTLKAAAYSGFPERFLHLKSLYIRTEEGYRGFVVESVAVQGGAVVLKKFLYRKSSALNPRKGFIFLMK